MRAFYEEMVDDSRRVTASVGSADTPCVPADLGINVRWVLLHMIEETARHAGHMDIIRESIDGSKVRGDSASM
jgi:hypothetical protein